MIRRRNPGFTLVEIMVVVLVIGIILTLALPNYVKSRKAVQKTICIENLNNINAAVDQWVLDNHIPVGTEISSYEEDVYRDYVRGGKPKCPSLGEYSLGVVGTSPQVTCSKEDEGHRLP